MKHIQLDELLTTLRRKSREVWLWVALDVETKVVVSLAVRPCAQAIAHRVVPLFTSDGLDHYFYALTAHFGQWCQPIEERKRQWEVSAQLWYGQIKKVYRRRRLVRVVYQMRLGQLNDLIAKVRELNLGHLLNTAFVEWVNLTLRQGVPALIRRTWSTAQE